MTFSLDLWQTILLVSMLLGAFLGLLKLLLSQHTKHIDAAFETQAERLGRIELVSQADAEQWRRLEKDFLSFKAELPLSYVRRDDYIRGQSVIEAKLDSLATKFENVQLRAAFPRDHNKGGTQ